MSEQINWQQLENHVRSIASYRWFRTARPETINGVKIDCVVKTEKDHWILVEVSKSSTLEKLRTDLAKFATVRPHLFSQNIFCRCYFVCESQPTDSLITAGEGQHVKVLSAEQFSKELIDHEVYGHARRARPFGSSVNPFTGTPDQTSYIPVEYKTADHRTVFSIEMIANRLSAGQHFILLGEYGAGKSRCLRQVFETLSAGAQRKCIFPFAIDLRRHWGAKSGEEIIRRHFQELGLTEYTDSVIRAHVQGGIIFLLDGFDEIGSQAWSDRTQDLTSIRREAVVAVRDLVQSNKSGIIITGREHFFDSNSEMLESLGMRPATTSVIYTQSEFTEPQIAEYIALSIPNLSIPRWLPRRPLICQVIASLEKKDLTTILQEEDSEVAFWKLFIKVLCEREARIHHALHADGIHAILKRLARISRSKPQNVGPISLTEIVQVFSELAGTLPVEESTAMLQRLPGMGRLSAESSDRQFVDTYILDGLRADDVIDLLRAKIVFTDHPINSPLGQFGQSIVSDELVSREQKGNAIHFIQLNSVCNPTLACDVIAALTYINIPNDFKNLIISDGEITCLDFSGLNIKNLTIENSVIHRLYLPSTDPKSVQIKSCIITKVYGLNASAPGLPDWITNSSAEQIHRLDTVDRIHDADLSPSQTILVTIIKKTFFQPGAGRKESSLISGLGEIAKSRITKKIMNRLTSTNILVKAKGESGFIYRPVRSEWVQYWRS